MKNRMWIVLSVVVGLQSGLLWAAAFPGAISRDSMVVAESLNRLSIGVDYEVIKRDILFDAGGGNMQDSLEAAAISGFLGVDITPWLTPFVTLGSSYLEDSDRDQNGDAKFKWSAGVNLNIWHYDIVSPDFLSGRLSIESMVEYASYDSESVNGGGGTVEWSDFSVVVPFCYEMFEDLSPLADKSLRKSLNLYVGPALSVIDGTVQSGFGEESFSEDEQVGFIAGGDIFLADKVSIGAHVMVFDQTTVTGSIRYHF